MTEVIVRCTRFVVLLLLVGLPLEATLAVEEPAKEEEAARAVPPELPAEVAKQVKELEEKVEDLRKQGIEGDDRAKQDAALGEAIKLSEEVLAIREKHQGRADGAAAAEKRREWWEVAEAKWGLITLRVILEMKVPTRAEFAENERKAHQGRDLYVQTRYSEAEILWSEVLEVSCRLFPGGHPYVVSSLHNLGTLLLTRGDLKGAKPLLQEALEMALQLFPGDHPNVAKRLSQLATLFHAQGNLWEAEPLCRKALDMERRILPADHLEVATSLNNLGRILQGSGDLQSAEPLLTEALQMLRRLFPDDHPHIATSLSNLGGLFYDRGDLMHAEPLDREALEMHRRLVPGDSPELAACLQSLGVLLNTRGELQGAELCFREAIDILRPFQNDSPALARALHNLGAVLDEQGAFQSAALLYRDALDMMRRIFPGDHHLLAACLGALAMNLVASGDLQGAEPLFKKSLDMHRRLHPGDHPSVALAINNLAGLLRDRGDLQGAEPLLKESLDMYHRLFPGDHPNVPKILRNLTILLQVRGDLQGAESHLRDALEMAERLRPRIVGDERARAEFSNQLGVPLIASSYAAVLLRLGRPSEAFGVSERGLARSLLDLLERGALDVVTKAKEHLAIDSAGAQRLQLVLAREEMARINLTTAEKLLEGLQKECKQTLQLEGLEPADREQRLVDLGVKTSSQLERVKGLRRALSDAGSAVLVELRGLFPEAKPLSSEAVLADLPKRDLVLGYLWSKDGVTLVTAGGGSCSGAVLAEKKDQVRAILERCEKVLTLLREPAHTSHASEARELLRTLLPKEIRDLVRDAARLVILPDGPLNDIPFEVLLASAEEEALREKPVVYAASATVYLQRLKAARDGKKNGLEKPGALVLGDPVYDRDPLPEPKYPEKGTLITQVQPGGTAAGAGLRRGDVLLAYDGRDVEPSTLKEAITAVSEAVENGKRQHGDVVVRYWRDGNEKEGRTKPGMLGVQVSQGELASSLRSLARETRGFENLTADVSATDQVRLFGGSLRRLPGTREEALAIAELLRRKGSKADVLLGEGAMLGRLSAGAVGSGILHLATHGLRGSAERPHDASLALTRPKDITPQDIGFLRLEDLLRGWRGKLEGTQLVVLSACETQRGAKVGDSAMSLPWGFFYAGAKTVIASLWRVDDAATSLLMARLYENLLGVYEKPRQVGAEKYPPGTGMGPEPALREARNWLRSLSEAEAKAELARVKDLARSAAKALGAAGGGESAVTRGLGKEVSSPVKNLPGTGRPYEHPYYWAAFICVGSPE